MTESASASVVERCKDAHKIMTPEEYASVRIQGWHMVCKDIDGFGNVGVRYVTPEPDFSSAREIDREKIARTICKSGKFETGEGTCAVICKDQLGDVRKIGCGHCERVHGKLADSILSLLTNTTGGRDV